MCNKYFVSISLSRFNFNVKIAHYVKHVLKNPAKRLLLLET